MSGLPRADRPAWSEHLLVGRKHAPNGCDQTLEFDRFSIELLAPCGNGLLALALLRMRGHADDCCWWKTMRTNASACAAGSMAARRRGGRVAACGARTTIDAGDRVTWHYIARE